MSEAEAKAKVDLEDADQVENLHAFEDHNDVTNDNSLASGSIVDLHITSSTPNLLMYPLRAMYKRM